MFRIVCQGEVINLESKTDSGWHIMKQYVDRSMNLPFHVWERDKFTSIEGMFQRILKACFNNDYSFAEEQKNAAVPTQ